MKEIWLDSREYAKIVSEINTNYAKYKGENVAAHSSFGLDGKAYIYHFINCGFGEYRFYARKELSQEVITWMS